MVLTFAEVGKERSITWELFGALGWDLIPVSKDEHKVFCIDITHGVEMVEEFTDVCLGAPNKDHPIAKDLVGNYKLFLSLNQVTNVSIEVDSQSMLMKMPCTLRPHLEGSASAIVDSEKVFEEAGSGIGGRWRSSLHERIW